MRRSVNVILGCVALTLLPPVGSASASYLPDLVIEKTADVDSVVPGGFITYTLYVMNQGIYPADDVLIRDTLPDGLTFISWDYSGPSWDYWGGPTQVSTTIWHDDRLSGFEQGWIYITAQLDPSYALDTIENIARVTCIDPEENFDNNESVLVTRVVPESRTALLVLVGLGSLALLRSRSTVSRSSTPVKDRAARGERGGVVGSA